MPRLNSQLIRALSDYGMVLMLLLLGVFFSLMTLTEQQPTGEVGGQQVANAILAQHSPEASIWVVTRDLPSDQAFAKTLTQSLVAAGYDRIHPIVGLPRDARAALVQWQDQGAKIDAIAGTEVTSTWLVFADLETSFPEVGSPRIYRPTPYRWPNFLKRDNLLNITNQIAVIAIIAIGMTTVIISGGIDLSVGSLIAFSAVLACLLI
ncbi:MAG: ABC transporter permease, partial [Verrucomicrobiota bacterium]|nr:ABC transporter permease [Verrucomicrobiota bacterium]